MRNGSERPGREQEDHEPLLPGSRRARKAVHVLTRALPAAGVQTVADRLGGGAGVDRLLVAEDSVLALSQKRHVRIDVHERTWSQQGVSLIVLVTFSAPIGALNV